MEEKVIDFEELVAFINKETGLSKEDIEIVLDMETEFLVQNGIIEE